MNLMIMAGAARVQESRPLAGASPGPEPGFIASSESGSAQLSLGLGASGPVGHGQALPGYYAYVLEVYI